MSETVSVVIPNWNGKHHLAICLDSLRRQTLQPEEVVVVDDASTDGSVEFLREAYPWVLLIARERNEGFTATVNAGIAASRGTLIALLNNDTELHPDWLASLVETLRDTPAAGSAASKMLRFDDRSVLDGAGDSLSRAASPYTRGFGEPDDGRYGVRENVFGACAGAALFRRRVFDTVGAFDEDFVAYYDDIDLAFRAQLAGFACVYVPEAICYHKRGASSGREGTRLGERNLTAVHVKDVPGPLLIVLSPLILLSRLRRLYRQIRQGAGGPALRGFLQGVGLIPAMVRKRRDVQRLRRVSLRYVVSLLGGNS